jgi:uncharacterized protein (TIGR02001 family)
VAPPRRHTLSVAVVLLALSLAAPASAQLGFSASVDSDYRFRGLSLSDGKPDLSLNLAYDHPSGFYAGASAIAAEGVDGGVRMFGYLEYAGLTRRIDAHMSWDAGVSNSEYLEKPYSGYRSDYTELYAGLSVDSVSAHVYYSPSYLGAGLSTIYVDLNGAYRPARHLRLFGHAGLLTPLSGSADLGGRRERYDLRAGVAADFGGAEMRLAWTATGPGAGYAAGFAQGRDAVVVGASYFF